MTKKVKKTKEEPKVREVPKGGCPDCFGTGFDGGYSKEELCTACDGTGIKSKK